MTEPTTGKARLSELLLAYAQANAAKNAGERAEKAARDALNREMIAQKVGEHQDFCDVDGALVPYRAAIEPRQAEAIDVIALRGLCPDEPTFLRVVSATKKAVEAVLGPSAVIAATVTIRKPAALSIERVR